MIGVFDSGVGGLSVLTRIRARLPAADLLYVADRARAPYGRRSLDEVRGFSEVITDRLLAEGAGLVVVACNTASAAALHHLRARHPAVPFVGMEPAVKPAAALSGRGVVGVLATAATFQGELFASVVDRYASGVVVVAEACTGWVELVERGTVAGPEAEAAVRSHLRPVLDAGADTLVLGCTHYPFLAPVIRAVAGDKVTVVDPSDAVARRVVEVSGAAAEGEGRLRVVTTAPTSGLDALVEHLTGLRVRSERW
ncbi:MAG: glutamate racemase [Acidimicrobiia bacterium]